MKLTAAGEVLLNEWGKTIESYDASIEKAVYTFRAIHGSISIGVLDGLKIDAYLTDMIEWIEKTYLNIRIKLKIVKSFIESDQVNLSSH